MAGSIEELKDVAVHLGDEGTQASRRLHDRIMQGVPRFEASEEVRLYELSTEILRTQILTPCRRGSVGIIETPAKPSSHVQSQDFHFTKVGPAASEFDILFPTKKKEPRMLLRPGDQLDSPVSQRRPSQQALRSPPVVVKLDLGLEALMAKAY